MPSPILQPHPPIYIAATRTPATLEFVVSTGHPLIIGVALDTDDALDLCHRFVRMSEESGHSVPMSRIPSSATFTSRILRIRRTGIPGRVWIGIWK